MKYLKLKLIVLIILILNPLINAEKKKIPGPKDGRLIQGVVINKKTGKPAEGEVLAIPADDQDGKMYTFATGKDGKFAFRIPKKGKYIIRVNVPECKVFLKKIKKKENWKQKTVAVTPKPKPKKPKPKPEELKKIGVIAYKETTNFAKGLSKKTLVMLNVFKNVKAPEKKPDKPKPVRRNVISKEEIAFIENVKIRFKFKTLLIPKKHYETLFRIAAILRKYPDVNIQVQGHTDIMHSVYRKLNYRIAYNRALIVQKFFVFAGRIPSSRIKVKSFGSDMPLVPNTSRGNRDKNRRVEFRIITTD